MFVDSHCHLDFPELTERLPVVLANMAAAFSSRMMRSVSSLAARVWMTSGLPLSRAARMWVRKRSCCQVMSPLARK